MSECPFSKLKEKLSTKKSNLEVQNNPKDIIEEETKVEVKDILDYLSPKDLETVNNQNITLQDFVDFMKSIQENELDEIKSLVDNYVKENLSDLQKLKKEVNNLHVKMFREYFKEKIEELGEHDFIGFKDGKLVNIPISEYTGNMGIIKNKLRNKYKSDFKTYEIVNDYLTDFLLNNKIISNIPFLKEIFYKINIKETVDRMYLMLFDFQSITDILYKNFLSKNKENDIITSYMILEKHISKEISVHSNFEQIFPNTNTLNIIIYLNYLYKKGINLKVHEVKKFLKRQNTENIRKALYLGSFGAQIDNLYTVSYGKYDNEKGIIVINIDELPKECIDNVDNIIKNHSLKGKGDGVCPFARTKSETQNKNALIEEFEFFDNYMLKILEKVFAE